PQTPAPGRPIAARSREGNRRFGTGTLRPRLAQRRGPGARARYASAVDGRRRVERATAGARACARGSAAWRRDDRGAVRDSGKAPRRIAEADRRLRSAARRARRIAATSADEARPGRGTAVRLS